MLKYIRESKTGRIVKKKEERRWQTLKKQFLRAGVSGVWSNRLIRCRELNPLFQVLQEGHVENPTYNEVVRGGTGHTEAVEITYDPDKITYKELVEIYWRQTDPTDASGQFADRGDSYRPVIYYSTAEEQEIAEQSKQTLQETGPFSEPVVTSIEPIEPFYAADESHQDFYKKESAHYKRYSIGSGRVGFLEEHWGEN